MAKTTTAGTPLTRYGSRLPAISPTPTAKVTSTPAVTRTPAATPTATIRTLIVCLPDEVPRAALTAHQLDRRFGVFDTLSPRSWATPALYPWQRGRLIGLRKGRPAASGATRPPARPASR
jgi:hypothetical protein